MSNVHFAIPGLMTPRPTNCLVHITAPEDGSLSLLLHAGEAEDYVNYSLVMGGHRYIGVVKDPSYHYAHGGLPMEGWHNGVYDNPLFSYITETLPDSVKVPYIDIEGCPVPITELNKYAGRPAYFILKLPRTALPVGDTIIQVQINGERRDYIVSRPDFAAHWPGVFDMGKMYDKLMDLPDGAFDLQTDNGTPTSVDVHVKDKRIPGIDYIVFMKSKYNIIDLNNTFTWTDDGWITIDIPQGLPCGDYKLVVSYSVLDQKWKIVTLGNIKIDDRIPDKLDVVMPEGQEYTVKVPLKPYHIPEDKMQDALFAAYVYDMHNDGAGQRIEQCFVVDGELNVVLPPISADDNKEWECFYSIMADDRINEEVSGRSWVPMAAGELKVEE